MLYSTEPIKDHYGERLSWSDLIVLSGTVALETAANVTIPFCEVGRVDAENGQGWQFLFPRIRCVHVAPIIYS